MNQLISSKSYRSDGIDNECDVLEYQAPFELLFSAAASLARVSGLGAARPKCFDLCAWSFALHGDIILSVGEAKLLRLVRTMTETSIYGNSLHHSSSENWIVYSAASVGFQSSIGRGH
jgi:hypothetical protein